MTTILFLLYLADLATGVTVVCISVGLIMLTVWCARWLADFSETYGEGAAARSMPNKRLLWVVIALLCVAAIMPSKTTLYAVAAVQAGDTFAESERGSKVLQTVDRWLDQQIGTED